jgi:hypothetical protein
MSETRAGSPLRSRIYQKVYHTPDRTRFFDAFHAKPADQTIGAFVKEHKHQEWCPCGNTLRRWLQQEAESTRTPTRRPPEKPRGRRAFNQAALDQVEIMARGPRELRLRDWQYHSEQAGVSDNTLRRYCKRRKPPVLRSERVPKQVIYNKETAVGYHWIFHEKGYKDGIKREPWEMSGNTAGSLAAVAPQAPQEPQAPQALISPSNFYEYVGQTMTVHGEFSCDSREPQCQVGGFGIYL